MADSEAGYKAKIGEALNYTLGDCVIPELGELKRGKVRNVYLTNEMAIMIATDRVSAFDYVLPYCIPFKGQVLNMISKWTFEQTADIMPSALEEKQSAADPNVMIQRMCQPIPFELIVRGYLWGSMADAYERGERTFCGLPCPEGMMRFQKFPTPLFTPTTKAEQGKHDENVTMKDMDSEVNGQAENLKELALKLYNRGAEVALQRGLILIDTKYEFGWDSKQKLCVIDEVNTPDSSRMCDKDEWDMKFPKIEAAMKTGKFKTVIELMKVHPELKIKEYSKQYVRDLLLERGFKPGGGIPELTSDQIVECSYRYIRVYERICGKKWIFPDTTMSPPQRLLNNLREARILIGCCGIILAGSSSDGPHVEAIARSFLLFSIPTRHRICSAHKQPGKLLEILNEYNKSMEPIVFVACAGGTDALSGTASFLSRFPVISCPPDGMNNSCLTNPPHSSNAFIMSPSNVGRFAAQMFSFNDPKIWGKLEKSMGAKVADLEKADMDIQSKFSS